MVERAVNYKVEAVKFKVEVVAEVESRDYKAVERAVDYKVDLIVAEEDYKVEVVEAMN